jgi:hypothetical protein
MCIKDIPIQILFNWTLYVKVKFLHLTNIEIARKVFCLWIQFSRVMTSVLGKRVSMLLHHFKVTSRDFITRCELSSPACWRGTCTSSTFQDIVISLLAMSKVLSKNNLHTLLPFSLRTTLTSLWESAKNFHTCTNE